MVVQSRDNAWLQISVHHLRHCIFVEYSSSPVEEVRNVLVVILLQVADQSWCHVVMVRAWPHTWEKLRPCQVMKVSAELPCGHYHQENV